MDDSSRPPIHRYPRYNDDPNQGRDNARRSSRRVTINAEDELYPHYARAREVRETNGRKHAEPTKGTYSTNGKRIRVQHDDARIDGFVKPDADAANRRATGFSQRAYREMEENDGVTTRQPGSSPRSVYGRESSRQGSGSSRPSSSRTSSRQGAGRTSERGSSPRTGNSPRSGAGAPYASTRSSAISARRDTYAHRQSASDERPTRPRSSAYRTSVEYSDEPSKRYSHPTVSLDAPLNASNLRARNRESGRGRRNSEPRMTMTAPTPAQELLSALPLKLIGIIVAVIAVLAILVFAVTSCFSCISGANAPEPEAPSATEPFSTKLAEATETTDDNGIIHGTANKVNYTLRDKGAAGLVEGKVSLAAVGDQLANDNALNIADGYKGKVGDGEYDFQPYYEDEIKPFLKDYDLKFINQETILHASKDWKAAGYPAFNSPANMVDTIDKVGFNLVSFCSNHIFDHWTDGLKASQKVFAKHPNLLMAGSYKSKKDRNTIQLIERNGITFALLAYGYGVNGYKNSDLPNSYYLTLFSKKTLKADVAKAKKVADVVIVYMHWGSEYTATPDATQKKYAQYLADLDVDLVLGSHAHITQPIKYYTGKNGNKTPVVFGMSDIISGYDKIDTILSGVFTCDFIKGEDSVTVENLKWYPCIEWSDGGKTYIRFIKDMTQEECDANKCVADCDDIYQYILDFEEELNNACEVVLSNNPDGENADGQKAA